MSFELNDVEIGSSGDMAFTYAEIEIRLSGGSHLAVASTDNGRLGYREDYCAGYYSAFVIDPDGHNIEGLIGTITKPLVKGMNSHDND